MELRIKDESGKYIKVSGFDSSSAGEQEAELLSHCLPRRSADDPRAAFFSDQL